MTSAELFVAGGEFTDEIVAAEKGKPLNHTLFFQIESCDQIKYFNVSLTATNNHFFNPINYFLN